MKKYKFIIKQLLCKKQTFGLATSDDVYIAVIPIKGKVKRGNALINTLSADSLIEGAAILKGLITDTMRGFDPGDTATPKQNVLEISLEDGEILSILIVLYEEDDGVLKKALEKTVPYGVDTVTLSNSGNYKNLINELWEAIKGKEGQTLESLFGSTAAVFFKVAVPTIELSYKLYQVIKSDDIIAGNSYEFDLNATNCILTPDPKVFAGKHGKYILDVELVEVSE